MTDPAEGPVVKRLKARIEELRGALLDLVEDEEPGSLEVLSKRPSIEAEIWSLEGQLAAVLDQPQKAASCAREAARCQGEARRAIQLETAAAVERLEARLGLRSDLGNRMERLK